MNEYELNEDQIRRIEARLNILHLEMSLYNDNGDRESYNYSAGRSKGICEMLNEIGYDAVWCITERSHCQIRKRTDRNLSQIQRQVNGCE